MNKNKSKKNLNLYRYYRRIFISFTFIENIIIFSKTNMTRRFSIFLKNAWAKEPVLVVSISSGPCYNYAHSQPLPQVCCLHQPGYNLQLQSVCARWWKRVWCAQSPAGPSGPMPGMAEESTNLPANGRGPLSCHHPIKMQNPTPTVFPPSYPLSSPPPPFSPGFLPPCLPRAESRPPGDSDKTKYNNIRSKPSHQRWIRQPNERKRVIGEYLIFKNLLPGSGGAWL